MSTKIKIALIALVSFIIIIIASLVWFCLDKFQEKEASLSYKDLEDKEYCAVRGTENLYCVNGELYINRAPLINVDLAKTRYNSLKSKCSCNVVDPLQVALTDENNRLTQELDNARQELFEYKNEKELLAVNLDAAVRIATEEIKVLDMKFLDLKNKCEVKPEPKLDSVPEFKPEPKKEPPVTLPAKQVKKEINKPSNSKPKQPNKKQEVKKSTSKPKCEAKCK